jgi:hypothetical protein
MGKRSDYEVFIDAMQSKLRQVFSEWSLENEYIHMVELSVNQGISVYVKGVRTYHSTSDERIRFLREVFSKSDNQWLLVVQQLQAAIEFNQPSEKFRPTKQARNATGDSGNLRAESLVLSVRKDAADSDEAFRDGEIISVAGVEFCFPLASEAIEVWREAFFYQLKAKKSSEMQEREKRVQLQNSKAELELRLQTLKETKVNYTTIVSSDKQSKQDFTNEIAVQKGADLLNQLNFFPSATAGVAKEQATTAVTTLNDFSRMLGFRNNIECVMGLYFAANSEVFGPRKTKKVIAAMNLFCRTEERANTDAKGWFQTYQAHMGELRAATTVPQQGQASSRRLLALFKVKRTNRTAIVTEDSFETQRDAVIEQLLLAAFDSEDEARTWLDKIATSKVSSEKIQEEADKQSKDQQSRLDKFQSEIQLLEQDIKILESIRARRQKDLESTSIKKFDHSKDVERLEQLRFQSLKTTFEFSNLRGLENRYMPEISEIINQKLTRSIDCIWADYDFYAELVSILFSLDSQNRKKWLKDCPTCKSVPLRCGCDDEDTRMIDYLQRWHNLSRDTLSSLLEDFGRWTWGLFHLQPLERIQNLRETFRTEISQFDRLILGLKLAPLMRKIFKPETEGDLLPSCIPSHWEGMNSVKKGALVGELDITLLTELVQRASHRPNPAKFVDENWRDYARKFERSKFERSIQQATEIKTNFDYGD